jgi:hypothetical protein
MKQQLFKGESAPKSCVAEFDPALLAGRLVSFNG